MTSKKPFYITTTLPYVNSKPHIGFALEVVRADTVARYKRLQNFDVFFNTGTDEHGVKIHQRAEEEGIDTQAFVDGNAEHFKSLKETLNLSYDKFIRTTDEDHKKAAQEFWKLCDKNGYIYKKKYKGLYCKGCEMFITDKDLVDEYCPHHPGTKPEEVEEENYFFKYSEFGKELLSRYESDEIKVVPEFRLNELTSLIEQGLEDFSISRLKDKMPWGVSVPGDDEHVMYVWFDALVNYISTLGWPEGDFEKYWVGGTPVQYCGKDNVIHQASRWQAMLLSVGLPTTNTVIVNGFVTSDGVKMSKSIGNVINPVDIVNEYGTDAMRYYLIREIHPYEDSGFTTSRFKEAYNANLANGIGNLTNRILKMSEDNLDGVEVKDVPFPSEYTKAFDEFNLQKVGDFVWKKIGDLDQKIQDEEPFKVIKEDEEKGKEIIKGLVQGLYEVALLLEPILPETSLKIRAGIKENKKPEVPLFFRKD
ncbi:MAG: methionyl-tRNA synthetase [Candidatus Paceibacteria bacterium]|jgi:methionyl-tRNA synthetase